MNGDDSDSCLNKIRYDFKLIDIKRDEGYDKKIYSVKFCECIPSLWNVFAAVGSNTISIYRINHANISNDGSLRAPVEPLELMQHHVDEDFSRSSIESSENYYTCAWATARGTPIIAAGGQKGIIKLVNIESFEVGALIGHGDHINELVTHPVDDGLIFSASKDRSVRLWNVRTLVCIVIFNGEKGHLDDILSLDIHALGNCMVTSSIDTSIKIWNLQDPILIKAIEVSDDLTSPISPTDRALFQVVYQQLPLFSTTAVHADYVDSVKWLGDGIVSKSTNNRVCYWTPDALRYKGAPLILQEYLLSHGEIWFVKLDVHIPLGLVAVGNSKGKVSIYPIGPQIPLSTIGQQSQQQQQQPMITREVNVTLRERFRHHEKICGPIVTLCHPKHTAVVRQTAFSPQGDCLVYCLDDGTLHLWSIEEHIATTITATTATSSSPFSRFAVSSSSVSSANS